MNSRRKFIHKSILTSAGLATLPNLLSAEHLSARSKRIGANDQINFGLIGCKGMGWSNMHSHLRIPEVNCVALADVDQSVLDQRTEDVYKLRGKRPKQYKDYRLMLEDPDIDAVIIGTPDHWHCLNLIDSLSAGKHAYTEKPLANSIEECNLMVKAVDRYGKLVQVGQNLTIVGKLKQVKTSQLLQLTTKVLIW